MPEVVNIARCPEHGLHGCRAECFVCGGEVEQVPMVPWADVEAAVRSNARLRERIRSILAESFTPSLNHRHPDGRG